jgi:hypothetical protein
MAKIKELVDIKTGYAKYVNLVQTFDDPTENRARMGQYMPVESHRQAFQQLTRALYPKDGRVYLLTGSYGTGKSHLCLMLANYLALKPNDPEMVAFFENWAQRDAAGAEKIRNLRRDGRYLVAICEYGVADDFDSIVLRAIGKACDREGIKDVWLDTEYHEAIRQIERWEAQTQAGAATSAVFRAFQDELHRLHSEWTLAALKEDLADYSQEARAVFKELYRSVVGNDFTYSKDNLVDILTDFLSNEAFKVRYKGLTVIADEFGDMLDRGAIRVSTFQRFAEMCERGVAGSSLIFVGTAHKPFPAYSGGGLSAVDFRVAADRVTEVPLASKGLEDIIAAIIIPDKTHPVWQAEVASRASMFNRFALTSSRAGIFAHLKGPELRERIIENIYPMHPMATHCVIQLSKEIGSNARSVFTFFTGAFSAGDGSYPWYVSETDVVTDDRLNLYTADLLTVYFQNELKPDNTDAREAVRQHIRNYHASLREVKKEAATRLDGTMDPLVKRILDLMLVYEVANVANTADNLAFGLYYEGEADRERLENRLGWLVQNKIVFRTASGVYEFRRSEAVDFETMIEDYKADPDNQPTDLAREVVELVPLGRDGRWLEAKNYNLPYDEDKRLLRVFVRPGDLEAEFTHDGETVDFFTHQERQMQAIDTWKDRYEGVAVYVLCETDAEIQRARRLVEKNRGRHVIVGVPRQPIPIREAVMNLRAVSNIQQTEDLDAMSLQDRSRLQQDLIGDEEKGYKGEFIRLRDRYLAGKELTWYTRGGRVLVSQPSGEYEPADELMYNLYDQRNSFPSQFLNTIHVIRFGPGKDAALSDAINALLRSHRPVEIDHNAAANRGEIRFLKKCLADQGALVQLGPYRGSIAQYETETNPEKFREKLPALAAMIGRLRKLDQGETVRVRDLVETFSRDPYGQGPAALSLYLAYVIRAFGDELHLQIQPGAVGWVTVQSSDLVLELVNGQHPNAVFQRQTISATDHAFINGLHNLFAAEPGAAGEQHTIREAFSAIHNWWSGLPNLARVTDIYPTDTYPTTRTLVELLNQIEAHDPYSFVLGDLQTVYGYDAGQALTDESQAQILESLKMDKAAIEGGPQRIKAALLTQLMAPFEPKGDMYGAYQAAIEAWYWTLNPGQQDPYAGWHNNQSQAIIQHLCTITNIETTFFEKLPAHVGFGLGRVDDWCSDRSADYVRMFKSGLAHIEAHRIQVPTPKWDVKGIGVKKQPTGDGAQIVYRGGVNLTVRAPEPDITVYLTDAGADPRDAEAQRLRIQDSYQLNVNRSPNIKLVSQASDGTYGQVITLSFVNEDVKYEVQPVAQQKLLEEEFKFVFPQDREALIVTLRSLLESALERGLVDQNGVRELLAELAGELGGGELTT